MSEQRFVIQPTDAERGYRVSKAAYEYLRQITRRARDEDQPQEIVFRPFQRKRSDPQRCTLWMWHGQVASELTLRTGKRWTKDDVHEVVFLPRFMPTKELMDPETGEILHRPVRTSDKAPDDDDRDMRSIISDAMSAYLAWVTDMGIEITVPEEGW